MNFVEFEDMLKTLFSVLLIFTITFTSFIAQVSASPLDATAAINQEIRKKGSVFVRKASEYGSKIAEETVKHSDTSS